MRICVYGASSNDIDRSYITAVEELGYKLAKDGHSMVYGAGANGLMGAAARGFTKGGGKITGVVPGFFNVDGILYDKCDEMIRPETMRERKRIMEEMADVFVIVPGGIGTFDELFEILTLKQLGRHAKAIAIYNINGYYDPMFEMLKNSVKTGFLREIDGVLYEDFEDVDRLIEYIESYVPEFKEIEELKLINGKPPVKY